MGGMAMPTYVTLYKFTAHGLKTVKDSPARVQEVREAFQAAGAKLVSFYALMGQYDTMIIAEAPSDEVIAKLNLLVGSWGNVSSRTMRAFTEDEWRSLLADIT